MSTGKMAKLEFDSKTIELPVTVGTEGEACFDIGELRAKTGAITMDNGLMNTGACYSAITFLDGDKGTLNYRGYPIDQLAEYSNFLETSYMLFHGNLPTAAQLKIFNDKVASTQTVPEGIHQLIKTFPKNAHPMSMLSSALVALSGHQSEWCEKVPSKIEDQEMLYCQLLAQTKILIAASFRHSQGLPYVPSNPKLDYCSDFLQMFFGTNAPKQTGPLVAKALDVLLILHADHEQNCSTSTVRMVGSSKANVFASMSAGVDALWGPLHGGANQKVIEMLELIHKDGGDFRKFILKAKDKNDNFLLMGFGHRVYKNFDPRAKIIKVECDSVLKDLAVKDSLLEIAKGLEAEALKDQYFVDRKLYPNVDFYSGIIYRAMGIPTEFFTPMFALGRMPGWFSQWKEMIDSPAHRIARPRQIYTGSALRDYVPLEKRH